MKTTTMHASTVPQSPSQPTLLTTLAANLRAQRLWPDGNPEQPCVIVIGVSGGADSTALLHGLIHLAMQEKEPQNWQLHVAHFDHALRAESAADATFVADQAATPGLPFHLLRATPEGLAHGNLEQSARRARYAFLAAVADRVTPPNQTPVIATAHHADDQAETLLLHLVRGAGLNGLGAMRWVTELTLPDLPRTVNLVRPLLNVRRGEIMEWLMASGLEWRRDTTNDDVSLARNQLRHVIRPQLEALNPNLIAALGRTADVLGADAERLRQLDRAQLETLIVPSKPAHFTSQRVVLNVDELARYGVSLQRGVLRAALEMLRPGLRDVTLDHVEQLRHALAHATPSTRPHPLMANICWTLAAANAEMPRGLSLHHADIPPFHPDTPDLGPSFPPTLLSADDEVRIGEWRVASRVTDVDALPADWRVRAQRWRVFLDAARTGQPLLTTPANLPAGSQFAPLGMGGDHKHLGDFFTDRKIPVSLRPGWPLIVDDATGAILWVCGLQPGHIARITDATTRIMALEWQQVQNADMAD